MNLKTQFYSQFREDEILASIFNFKKQGFCIEIGAYDGVICSNTYFFEKLGWDCLVVEPIPELCEAIRRRRQCIVANVAISDRNGETDFFIAEKAEILSTLETRKEITNRIDSEGGKLKKIRVKTQTLESLLNETGFSVHIDFVSIDVEGHEFHVLQGFPFHTISPKILIIEDNTTNHNLAINNYLSNFGYIRFKRTGCNDWYAKSNDYSIINLFNVLVLKTRMIIAIFRQELKRMIQLMGK